MKHARSYRGARRNAARRAGKLGVWRETAADGANRAANLSGRAIQANAAREYVSKALVGAGVLAGPAYVSYAFLNFYAAEKRTRVVSRIIKTLVKTLPPVRKRAA